MHGVLIIPNELAAAFLGPMTKRPAVPIRNAVVVWLCCLYDGDGGDEDYIWRTAIFSNPKAATAWAAREQCNYQLHEMVVDEPMFGWEAVN